MAPLGLPRKELRREDGKGKVVPVTWPLKNGSFYIMFISPQSTIILLLLFLWFETGAYVAQAGLLICHVAKDDFEFLIFLPLPPMCKQPSTGGFATTPDLTRCWGLNPGLCAC